MSTEITEYYFPKAFSVSYYSRPRAWTIIKSHKTGLFLYNKLTEEVLKNTNSNMLKLEPYYFHTTINEQIWKKYSVDSFFEKEFLGEN